MVYWPSLLLFAVHLSEDMSVDAVEPFEVEDEGGTALTITGQFVEAPAEVFIVANGVDVPCYSGKIGQGYNPVPYPTTLFVASPPLPIGGPYDIKVVQGVDEVFLYGALTVVARNWNTKVFELRRSLPPNMATGLRTLATRALLPSLLTVQAMPDLAAVEPVAYSFDVDAYNPLGATLVWSSVGTALPSWLALDTGTGTLSGTPAPGDVGTTVGHQLEVTDGVTIVQTNTFDLVVT